MSRPVIQLKNVTKKYGNARGVEAINLSVEPGIIFGFLGPNGSGKSTTINMLLDFIRPTSGEVKIFGLDSQKDSVEIRKNIGFLAGDTSMDRGLTGWQQLEFLGNLRGGFDKKYVQVLADRLNCDLSKKFKNLSRGNKQKVGLISTLMHKPDLLIMDEPTSGLDPLIQAEFNKIILEHKAAGGTAFISSHVLSEVQEICDHVAFIKNGKLIASRPMSDLSLDAPMIFDLKSASKDLQKRLTKFAGVNILSHKQNVIHGTFGGDINKLLRLLAGYSIDSFRLSDSDLESIFMKYYEDDDA